LPEIDILAISSLLGKRVSTSTPAALKAAISISTRLFSPEGVALE
jgi:hypothetical protein